MIPKAMQAYLKERLPEQTWETRLVREESLCYLEFTASDVDRLARLGIEVDSLGPRLVVAMWDEDADLEIGGYLVVDNLAMGRPSMGGIRMLPDVTPAAIHNLARGMTLKNAAADLPYGGGKSGIVSGDNLSPEQHREVVRGFARLLYRYHTLYLPGPDVGTNDEDMKTVAIQNGLNNALSKPADMGGNRIDQLGTAGGGVIIALQALLEEMPRLCNLPQFAGLRVPKPGELTVLIQGFGAVGANAAAFLQHALPGTKVTGISDAGGYLYSEGGLDITALFSIWQDQHLATLPYYQKQLVAAGKGIRSPVKFSTCCDDLLRENAFALLPAAPVANYLDTEAGTHPCMTVERMGRWSVIVEGANTYSPDPARKAARARMERAVYRQRGVLIATDYLVNSGGVIFAAQEHLIKTPANLRIPDELLGERAEVERWLKHHSDEFQALAEQRRRAGETYRNAVLRRNMRELVDLLAADADLLPCEAAERISIHRIASREADRTASDVMESIPTIGSQATVQEAAAVLVESNCSILAVIGPNEELAGVITDWDVTRAAALGRPGRQPLSEVMTRQVISAAPGDNILDLVRKLEYHEISAMPVVENGCVQGMVSADMLARTSLLRLLQSESA